MRIVLFEDDKVQQLDPITLSRPAYTIGCAGERLVDWAISTGSSVQGVVRPYLQAWQQAEYPALSSHDDTSNDVLLVNARVAPIRENLVRLSNLLHRPDNAPILHDESLAAAVVPAADLPTDPHRITSQYRQVADRRNAVATITMRQ